MPRHSTPSKGVQPEFKDEFKVIVKTKDGQQLINDLVFTLCDILDDCVTEESTWFTVGLAKNGSQIMLTLHEGRMTYFAGGTSLAELARGVISL